MRGRSVSLPTAKAVRVLGWTVVGCALAGWLLGEACIAVAAAPQEGSTAVAAPEAAPGVVPQGGALALPAPPPPAAAKGPAATEASEPVAGLGVMVTRADEGGGVLILDVAPSGPADVAGLCRGDRILAIGGRVMTTPEILVQYVRDKLPGSQVYIGYWHSGSIVATSAVLVAREEIPGFKPESRDVPTWEVRNATARPSLVAAASE